MTLDEMTETLTRLGIEVMSTRGDEIQALCPAHKERTGKDDHNPSWWINAESGLHNCFSCGWKGSLYSLISYMTGVEYEEAKTWSSGTQGLLARYNKVLNPEQPKIEEPVRVTESMLSAFTSVPDYAMSARGLAPRAVSNYGLKWDERNKNWIIPIRDAHTDDLLGWQEKGFAQRYFKNQPSGVKKSTTLFGFHELITNYALVVESPLDVVRLSSLGFPAVAVFGAKVSKEQFKLLQELDKVIIAMDNDEAGKASSLELLEMCTTYGLEAWFFNYGTIDVKDVGAMSLDEVKFGIDNANHMVKGKKVVK